MFDQNTVIDNSEKLHVDDCLKEWLAKKDCTTLDVATGYWDLPGTRLLLRELQALFERGGKMRLLIGIEPQLREWQKAEDTHNTFPDFYIKRDIAKLGPEFRETAQTLADFIRPEEGENSPLQVRVYRGEGKFLHAKCYIFGAPHKKKAIIGSSNFTLKGLRDNAELNYFENNSPMVMSSTSDGKTPAEWFEELWQNSEEWSGKFLQDALLPSSLGKLIKLPGAGDVVTPYEVWIRGLARQFGEVVDENAIAQVRECFPAAYSPYGFQIEAVLMVRAKMRQYGGFMLADVVGLGKTVVAAAVSKQFLLNAEGRPAKVLVITPPAMKESWRRTFEEFGCIAQTDIISIGKIDSLLEDDDTEDDDDDWQLPEREWGLILIDESHRFRNDENITYRTLNECIARHKVQPYVGLLSATPLNNTPEDVKNQLWLFIRQRAKSKFGEAEGGNVQKFFDIICKKYKDLRKEADELAVAPDEEKKKRIRKELDEIMNSMRKKVLEKVLVRRTRKDVEMFFKEDLVAMGGAFPVVEAPKPLIYQMSEEHAELLAETIKLMVSENADFDDENHVCWVRYQAIRFLKNAKDREKYGRKQQDVNQISAHLAYMCRTLAVKRLESSITAFREYLKNLHTYTNYMIEMWERNEIFICPDMDVNAMFTKFDADTATEVLREKIEKRKHKDPKRQNCEYSRADFEPRFFERLQKDANIIAGLRKKWDALKGDTKRDEFKRAVRKNLFDKKKNPAGKLIVFTEALPTQKVIAQVLAECGFGERTLLVSSKNRKKLETEIRANFDANVPKTEQKDDYSVLVTTEALAEGVNMHRANVLVNYDSPWNATRLMQRAGRVNRIGSSAKEILIYNFMPSKEGNNYIQLIQKSLVKLQAFYATFGEDVAAFSQEEVLRHYKPQRYEDETSPSQPLIDKLKHWRDEHPSRWEELLKMEGPLCAATVSAQEGWFIVENTKGIADNIYVHVADGEAEEFARDSFFEQSEPPEDASCVALPANWNVMSEAARSFAIRNLSKGTTTKPMKGAKEASKVLHTLLNDAEMELDAETKARLRDAMDHVNNGNVDVIKKAIKLGDVIEQYHSSFAPVTADEVKHEVMRCLHSVHAAVTKKFGDVLIFTGIAK